MHLNKPHTPTGGVHYMILAALFFSLMTLFVKIAGARLPSMEIVFLRGVITLGYSAVALRMAKMRPWGTHHVQLIMRGVFGFLALCCLYYAVTKLPLADATVIQYTNAVFTAVLASVFLNERIRAADIVGTLLSLTGVVLVARPSFIFGGEVSAVHVGASLIALVGALCSADAYIMVRRLKDSEPSLIIIFYFPLVTSILSLPFAAARFVWPTPVEWLTVIFGVGLCAQFGQLFLTKGLKREPAGRAMAISYLQIVFAAIWGALFLNEYPTPMTYLGAVLVILGTTLAAVVGKKAVPEPQDA